MKTKFGFFIFAVVSVLISAGCTKSDDSKKTEVLNPNAPNSETPAQSGAGKKSEKGESATSPAPTAADSDVSESANSNKIAIKRLRSGNSTMDVFNANPKGAESSLLQKGSLTLVLCGPTLSRVPLEFDSADSSCLS